MLKSKFSLIAIFLTSFFLTFLVNTKIVLASETIELPKEELAKESVVPVFDVMQSTKNRNIMTEGRIETNFFYGLALTEPVANVSRLGLSAYYNTSENHAWGVLFAKNQTGLSTYAKQLNSEFALDLSRAPYPDYTLLGDYNFKAYYGKMSLTKSWVSNFVLLFSGGVGVVKYVHKTYPLASLGLGQKIYFTKQVSLRMDLRIWGNNAPIPFKAGSIRETDPKPDFKDFDERFTLSTNLDLGISYLF